MGTAVIQMIFNRSWTEVTLDLGPLENPNELVGQLDGTTQLSAFTMTTRRRGSSPTEMVLAPSISFTVS